VPQVVIENPILNSPFEEPSCHSRFDKKTASPMKSLLADDQAPPSFELRVHVPVGMTRNRCCPATFRKTVPNPTNWSTISVCTLDVGDKVGIAE
jgi:hypothetical protein